MLLIGATHAARRRVIVRVTVTGIYSTRAGGVVRIVLVPRNRVTLRRILAEPTGIHFWCGAWPSPDRRAKENLVVATAQRLGPVGHRVRGRARNRAGTVGQ